MGTYRFVVLVDYLYMEGIWNRYMDLPLAIIFLLPKHGALFNDKSLALKVVLCLIWLDIYVPVVIHSKIS